jgi:hypothetical protein
MFFKLQPLIYSLFFLLSLEVVVFKEDWMELMAGVLIGITVLIVWPLTRKPRFIALPFFLSLGALALLSLVDHFIEKQIFIFLISGVYYLTLLGGYRLRFYASDQTALGMVNLATLSTVFLWFTAALGFYLNFHVQHWVMIVFVGTVFFISLPSFYTNAQDFHNRIHKEKKSEIEPKFVGVIFLSLILALIMSQLLWGILFWPFGYLTLGGSALIIFYEFWDVIRLHLRGELILKRIVTNFAVGIILLIAILLTAQWNLIPKI